MKANTFPAIESFIIRFVLDETSLAENTQPRYHGKICHIQSDDELVFHAWEDVVEFLERYVPLETKSES